MKLYKNVQQNRSLFQLLILPVYHLIQCVLDVISFNKYKKATISLNKRIKDEKYNMLWISSGKINKCKYLTGEEILLSHKVNKFQQIW